MNANAALTPGKDIKSLEDQGWSLLQAERYDEAIKTFDDVFQRDNSSIAAFQGRIAAYRKNRDFVKAEGLLTEALRVYPDQPGILSEQAWLDLAQKRYDQAIAAFGEVIKRYKKDEGLFLWRASLLRWQRRMDEAEKTIEEAIRMFPESARVRTERGWLVFYQRRYDEALESFEAILQSDEGSESAIQGRIASLRMKGCFAEANVIAQAALAQLDSSPGIRSECGWLNIEQGNLERAVEEFEKALTLAPKDPFSHINLAWALVRRAEGNDLNKAAERCRQARQLDPDLPEVYGLLGIIASKRGSLREAESNLLRSIRLDPMRGYYADLGAHYLQMGRYDEAKEKIEQAVKNNPDDAYARLQLGNLYLLTEKAKEAIQEFRSAAAMDPMNPDSHKSLALALMEGGSLVEAETVLRKAIRRLDEPRRWDLHLTLCQVLTRLGDTAVDTRYYVEALEEVGKAHRIKPRHSAPYFHSGVVRFKIEDLRGALKDFGRCGVDDEYHLEAELNAKRIRSRIREEKVGSRSSLFASILLGLVLLSQLIALWGLHFWTDKVSETTLVVLVPILLGLLVVAILLPWLTHLKLAGLEAELSEPKPKEALAIGPKGEIGFGSTSPKSG